MEEYTDEATAADGYEQEGFDDEFPVPEPQPRRRNPARKPARNRPAPRDTEDDYGFDGDAGYDENHDADAEYGYDDDYDDYEPDDGVDLETVDQDDYDPPRRNNRGKARGRARGRRGAEQHDPSYDGEPDGGKPKRGFFSRPPAPPRKERGKRGPKKSKEKEHKVAFAGGRGKLIFLRWMVFAVLGLIILAGMRAVFLPNTGPDEADIEAMVATQVSHGGFPAEAGTAFALMCADAFLSYDQADRDSRKNELTQCTPTTDAFVGWNGRGTQDVVAGPFPAAPPEVRDKNNAFFTVAAKVTNGGWIYLSVPIYADATGKLAMAGVPALMPPPSVASPPGGAGISKNDRDAQDALATMLPGFFAAWGASDSNSLDRYVTRDADPATLTGLRGSVELLKVSAVRVPDEEGATTRVAEVDVTWSVPDGGEWEQSYRVTVVNADSSWYVKSVDGATSLAGPGDTSTAEDPADEEDEE